MTHDGTRLAEHAPIAVILAGSCLLLFGRKLFWLFVGVSGFLAGIFLVRRFFGGQSELATLVVGIVAGLLGACFAIFLQKMAVAIAGFFAGGYLAVDIVDILGSTHPQFTWLVFLVGGILGAALVVGLFDWALIILSSLLGASLITRAFHPAASIASLVLAGLCIAGIAVQAGLLHRDRRVSEAV